jgi:hypothetical protein
MSDATKARLQDLARKAGESGAKIGYTQVGAFMLEESLANMYKDSKGVYEGAPLPSVAKPPTHLQKLLEAVRYRRDLAALLAGFESLNSEQWYCVFLDGVNGTPWLHELGVQFGLKAYGSIDLLTQIVKKLGRADRANALNGVSRVNSGLSRAKDTSKRRYRWSLCKCIRDINDSLDPASSSEKHKVVASLREVLDSWDTEEFEETQNTIPFKHFIARSKKNKSAKKLDAIG